jgi:hypothetical protein
LHGKIIQNLIILLTIGYKNPKKIYLKVQYEFNIVKTIQFDIILNSYMLELSLNLRMPLDCAGLCELQREHTPKPSPKHIRENRKKIGIKSNESIC